MSDNTQDTGISNLYEALNKKAMEMAAKLNSIDLKNVSLDDPKDKTFDRIRFMINDSASLAEAIRALGAASGKIVDEEKEQTKKPFVNTIAQDRN